MSLASKLTELKTSLSGLLSFANNKTGASDTSIGDAIRTLANGYGGGGNPFILGGTNATLIAEYQEQYHIEDTSFVIGQTAPSTATTIKPSISNAFTNTTGSPTVAFGDKDIIVLQWVNVEVFHDNLSDGLAQQDKGCFVTVHAFSKRKTSKSSNKTTRQVWNVANSALLQYNNASGVLTRASATYGIYATPQAPTVASATSNSTYVRAGSPSVSARTSTTYEKSASMKHIEDFAIEWNVKVYTVDAFSSWASAINDIHDLFLSDGDDSEDAVFPITPSSSAI